MKMVGYNIKLLLLLLTGISSSSGYHDVELTARQNNVKLTEGQYISKGDKVQFSCVFRTNEAKPAYIRMVLEVESHRVEDVGNDQIKWQSTGNVHQTELTHTSTNIYKDVTYNCTAYFGDSPRQSASDIHKVMVCCPLRIESKRPVIDMSHDIYGLDITVSGNDVGEGTVVPTNTNSPVSVSVTSSVTTGRFQHDQTQATLFSVRWKMRPEGAGSCAHQEEDSNDYNFKVHGQTETETDIEEPFETFYPALWKGIARQVYTVAQDDRYNRSLRCDICAYPRPTINWYLCGKSPPSDVIISQSGAELIIPEVQDRHLGVYVCAATNDINDQKRTKKFKLKLYRNGSEAEPHCLRDTRIKTFVVPTVIVIVVAVIVCIICWKCRQIQDFCQGLKEHVTSDLPKDCWIEKDSPPTALDRQPPDVLPDQKPSQEPGAGVEGVQYAVLDELKPCPERTATLPRGHDDDERVEYATIVCGNK